MAVFSNCVLLQSPLHLPYHLSGRTSTHHHLQLLFIILNNSVCIGISAINNFTWSCKRYVVGHPTVIKCQGREGMKALPAQWTVWCISCIIWRKFLKSRIVTGGREKGSCPSFFCFHRNFLDYLKCPRVSLQINEMKMSPFYPKIF